MAQKKVRYYTKTYESTKCFIFEFKTDSNNKYQLVHGWDNANDRYGRQVLSKHADGYLVGLGYKPIAKINAGFFYTSSQWEGFDTQFMTIGMCWRTNDGTPLLSNENGSASSNGWHLLYNDGAATPYLGVGWVDLQQYCDPLWGITLSYRLVDNGQVSIHDGGDSASWSTKGAQPRTLVGWKSDGTNVWVVTGGRGTNGTGLTAEQAANLMVQLGCQYAINADGGGSSEMIVNGTIKNTPTDGGERAVSTSLILYSLDTVTYVGEGESLEPGNGGGTEPDQGGETHRDPWEGFNVFNSSGYLCNVDSVCYYDSTGAKREIEYIAVYDSNGNLAGKYGPNTNGSGSGTGGSVLSTASAKLVLDPGHGYYTSGKRTPDDIREWTLNNAVCLKAMAKLQASFPNLTIHRTDDPTGKTDIALSTRVETTNSIDPDLFISIHHNASSDSWVSGITGVEVFVHTYGTDKDKEIAGMMARRLSALTGLTHRRTTSTQDYKLAEYTVLGCDSGIPAILCEGGFMNGGSTTTGDSAYIRSDAGQEAYAQAIHDIVAYFLFNIGGPY